MIKSKQDIKYLKLMVSFLLFISPFYCLFAKESPIISKKIIELSIKNDNGVDDSFRIGQEMLSISVNDCEKSKAYLRLGDAKFKGMLYIQAIEYLNKVDSFAPKCNLLEDQVTANFLLMMIYIDLKNDPSYHKAWKKVIETCKLIDDPTVPFLLLQVNAIGYETENNFKKAVFYRKEISNYAKKQYYKDRNVDNQLFLAMTYNLLSYDLLKSNQVTEAEFYFDKSSKLMEGIPKERDYMLQKQYLIRAMLYAEKKMNQQATIWFDKALAVAKSKKNINSILNIYEERLNYGIDNIENRKKITDGIKKINQDKLKLSSDYSNSLIHKKDIESFKLQDKLLFSFAIISLLVISILCISIYSKRRNKKTKQRFENIIENLENKERLNKLTPKSTNKSSLNINQKSMSTDKEKELLKKLIDFENGEIFTEKGFTMSNMEAILGSNRMYINQLLQKHRSKSFNDYINEVRIKYIIQKLVESPECLNYKISYLAELSGFANHSRFTQIFKKELQISPSEFIEQLKNKNK